MSSQMHTPQEWIRPALIRHLAAKLKSDEEALAQRLAPLSDRGIIAALHLNATRTRAALDAALRSASPSLLPTTAPSLMTAPSGPSPARRCATATQSSSAWPMTCAAPPRRPPIRTRPGTPCAALGWQN